MDNKCKSPICTAPPLKMKKTPNSLQKIFWEPKIFSKIQGEEHHEDICS